MVAVSRKRKVVTHNSKRDLPLASIASNSLSCHDGLSHVASLIEGPPNQRLASSSVGLPASRAWRMLFLSRVAVQCYCWQRYREYLQKTSSLYYVAKCEYTRFLIVM